MSTHDISPVQVDTDGVDSDRKNNVTTVEAAVKAVKAGNAKDVDIAAQIIADYADEIGADGWSKEEERKLIRKVDWWLIPIVSHIDGPVVFGSCVTSH